MPHFVSAAGAGRRRVNERRAPSLREATNFVAQRYARLAPMSAPDIAMLQDLPGPVEEAPKNREIHVEGRPPASPRFLVSGWACRFRLLGDGRRMILGFVVPGDGIRVCGTPHPLALSSVSTISDCVMVHAGAAFGPHQDFDAHLSLDGALRVARALDECWLISAITRLGRQTALERLAHLLLELHWRLDQVGLGDGWRFSAPLTQDILADAVGLSTVHVNRTAQQLRREGLVEWRHQTITILEPALLGQIAEFRPPQIADWRPQRLSNPK